MNGVTTSKTSLLVGTALLLLPFCASSTSYPSKQVIEILAPDGRPCAFFRLSGVNEADPAVPGQPWFAVSTASAGYKEIFTILLTARVSGQSVRVKTTGGLVCSYAEVNFVSM